MRIGEFSDQNKCSFSTSGNVFYFQLSCGFLHVSRNPLGGWNPHPGGEEGNWTSSAHSEKVLHGWPSHLAVYFSHSNKHLNIPRLQIPSSVRIFHGRVLGGAEAFMFPASFSRNSWSLLNVCKGLWDSEGSPSNGLEWQQLGLTDGYLGSFS